MNMVLVEATASHVMSIIGGSRHDHDKKFQVKRINQLLN